LNSHPSSLRPHRGAAIRSLLVRAWLGFALVGLIASGAALGQQAATRTDPEVYETIYLTNLTQVTDANEVVTALRNMVPNAKLYYVPSQGAITFRGTEQDLATAKKIVVGLDKTKKVYRLTYTVREMDNGKLIGTQRYSAIVASGSTTILKEGSRIPILEEEGNKANTSVTYLDLGEEIQASLDGYLDGARLRSRIVRSSIAEDKSTTGLQDPVIRQTTLEGTSILVQDKPLVIGTLDEPGSTRHQEIEVVSELVR
jgi:hypothetical protein